MCNASTLPRIVERVRPDLSGRNPPPAKERRVSLALNPPYLAFQLEMSVDLGVRFNSRKKFVDCLEEIVPDFYNNVGQYVRTFVPPPPKYKKEDIATMAEEQQAGSVGEPMPNDKVPEKAIERPVWVAAWQASPITGPDSQS